MPLNNHTVLLCHQNHQFMKQTLCPKKNRDGKATWRLGFLGPYLKRVVFDMMKSADGNSVALNKGGRTCLQTEWSETERSRVQNGERY